MLNCKSPTMAVVLADWLLLWMIRDDAVGVNIGHEKL